MRSRALDTIRAGLQAYADRGVFRAFEESRRGRGRHAFTFLWLTGRPVELSYDSSRDVLRFNNLLPNIASTSKMYSELKDFLRQYHDGPLPRHRLVDKKRAELVFANRRGNVSIALKIKNRQYGYGLNRLINMAHEVFVHLQYSYADYMYENFDVPEE